jgi:hypothetical protein
MGYPGRVAQKGLGCLPVPILVVSNWVAFLNKGLCLHEKNHFERQIRVVVKKKKKKRKKKKVAKKIKEK